MSAATPSRWTRPRTRPHWDGRYRGGNRGHRGPQTTEWTSGRRRRRGLLLVRADERRDHADLEGPRKRRPGGAARKPAGKPLRRLRALSRGLPPLLRLRGRRLRRVSSRSRQRLVTVVRCAPGGSLAFLQQRDAGALFACGWRARLLPQPESIGTRALERRSAQDSLSSHSARRRSTASAIWSRAKVASTSSCSRIPSRSGAPTVQSRDRSGRFRRTRRTARNVPDSKRGARWKLARLLVVDRIGRSGALDLRRNPLRHRAGTRGVPGPAVVGALGLRRGRRLALLRRERTDPRQGDLASGLCGGPIEHLTDIGPVLPVDRPASPSPTRRSSSRPTRGSMARSSGRCPCRPAPVFRTTARSASTTAGSSSRASGGLLRRDG